MFFPTSVNTLTRYAILQNTTKSISHINKALCQLSVLTYNEENLAVIEAFLCLEWLTNQRPAIRSVKFIIGSTVKSAQKKAKIKTKKPGSMNKNSSLILQVVLNCTLRQQKLIFFLNLLSLSFVKLKDKYLQLTATLVKNSLFFKINDFDYFAYKPDYLRSFYPISFFLFLQPPHLLGGLERLFYYRDSWQSYQYFSAINWQWRTI